jgi:hypothetical protein
MRKTSTTTATATSTNRNRTPRIGITVAEVLEDLISNGPATESQLLGPYRNDSRDRWGNSLFLVGEGLGSEASLVKRGLVKVVGSLYRARVYDITPKGRAALRRYGTM